jgi:hypothetical protein
VSASVDPDQLHALQALRRGLIDVQVLDVVQLDQDQATATAMEQGVPPEEVRPTTPPR